MTAVSNREIVRWLIGLAIAWLSWRIVAPVMPALSLAFALAIFINPLHRRLEARSNLPASAALADTVPTLNVQATCRATPAVTLDQQGTYDNCMRSENAARDRLAKSWGKMRADWRSTCLKTTTLGGIPSYVELLTCVEMREAAANGQSGRTDGTDALAGGTNSSSADLADALFAGGIA